MEIKVVRLVLIAITFAMIPIVSAAQQNQSPVLTLNQEALYLASDYGKRVQKTLEKSSRSLADENRQIEAALVNEERRLTDERSDMEPEAFRVLAEEFDTRVTEIRKAQDAKREAIQNRSDAERARFYELAFPILLGLVSEIGAVAILDSSAVIFSVRHIDITDRAIELVNREIGEARPDEVSPGLPQQRPDASTEGQSVETDRQGE